MFSKESDVIFFHNSVYDQYYSTRTAFHEDAILNHCNDVSMLQVNQAQKHSVLRLVNVLQINSVELAFQHKMGIHAQINAQFKDVLRHDRDASFLFSAAMITFASRFQNEPSSIIEKVSDVVGVFKVTCALSRANKRLNENTHNNSKEFANSVIGSIESPSSSFIFMNELMTVSAAKLMRDNDDDWKILTNAHPQRAQLFAIIESTASLLEANRLFRGLFKYAKDQHAARKPYTVITEIAVVEHMATVGICIEEWCKSNYFLNFWNEEELSPNIIVPFVENWQQFIGNMFKIPRNTVCINAMKSKPNDVTWVMLIQAMCTLGVYKTFIWNDLPCVKHILGLVLKARALWEILVKLWIIYGFTERTMIYKEERLRSALSWPDIKNSYYKYLGDIFQEKRDTLKENARKIKQAGIAQHQLCLEKSEDKLKAIFWAPRWRKAYVDAVKDVSMELFEHDTLDVNEETAQKRMDWEVTMIEFHKNIECKNCGSRLKNNDNVQSKICFECLDLHCILCRQLLNTPDEINRGVCPTCAVCSNCNESVTSSVKWKTNKFVGYPFGKDTGPVEKAVNLCDHHCILCFEKLTTPEENTRTVCNSCAMCTKCTTNSVTSSEKWKTVNLCHDCMKKCVTCKKVMSDETEGLVFVECLHDFLSEED